MAVKEARAGELSILHDCSVTFRYVVPHGHTIEDLKSKTYWRHNAPDLKLQRYAGVRPWHRIECIADDGTYECDLRVLDVTATGEVTVRVLRAWHAETKATKPIQPPEGYKLEHVGGRGWRALDPNGQILTADRVNEIDAYLVAADHARLVKAA